jgi:pimeloyl-ACP methyl ester carboxylesterase
LIKTVVLLHGIWSHGVGMFVIRRQLEREYGLDVHYFNYPSLKGTLDHNAAALYRFVDRLGKDGVHIIGHSLGGVVALRMLATRDDAPAGRIVCLGSPLTGSRAAEFLNRQDWADGLLGATLPQGVLEASANDWGSHVCAERDVGVIAGNVPLGVGRIVTTFDGPSDGTVAVAETRLDGTRDHLVMPVSHRGMVVSRRVADQAWAFLRRGEFLRSP